MKVMQQNYMHGKRGEREREGGRDGGRERGSSEKTSRKYKLVHSCMKTKEWLY